MKETAINVGLIFNHLPQLMILKANAISSQSDWLLKLSRLFNPDQEFGADDQIFRKIRKNQASIDDLTAHFSHLKPDSQNLTDILARINEDDLNPISMGGWQALAGCIHGYKNSPAGEMPELTVYLDFLLALCDVDKKALKHLRSQPPKENLPYMNSIIEQWLALPGFSFESTTIEHQARYIIAMALHWAALFEHLLYIDNPQLKTKQDNQNSPLCLAKHTPQIKENQLISATECWLTTIRNRWARDKYDKASISWTTFYQDIEKAKHPDELTATVDPCIANIKKRFSRWRNGKSSLTIDGFKKHVMVIYTPYDKNEVDISLFIISFIQLFDIIQRDLMANKLCPKFISEQFANYPKYFDLVARRYEIFHQTKKLQP